jgi:hypothetical protein
LETILEENAASKYEKIAEIKFMYKKGIEKAENEEKKNQLIL